MQSSKCQKQPKSTPKPIREICGRIPGAHICCKNDGFCTFVPEAGTGIITAMWRGVVGVLAIVLQGRAPSKLPGRARRHSMSEGTWLGHLPECARGQQQGNDLEIGVRRHD